MSVTSKVTKFRIQKSHMNNFQKNNPTDSFETDIALLEILKEVKELSGNKTWDYISKEIAKKYCGGLSISADMLRQYSCGKKSVSHRRLADIALAISKAGWAGSHTVKALDFFDLFKPENFGMTTGELREFNLTLDKQRNATSRAKKAAIERLYSALEQMFDCTWQEHEIAYMAVAMIEKITPIEERTGGGGLITPIDLPIHREIDIASEHVWLSWKIENLSDPQVAADIAKNQHSAN